MPKAATVKAHKKIVSQKQSTPNLTISNGHTSMKEATNGEHPISSVKCSSTWVCKNLACKAIIPSEDSFCKRCSCFICHKYDDNKDPSLWLACASENDSKNCCGLSCHLECVLQQKRVGCFDLQQTIHLDGSYSCAACGKVSGILGYLKRQLVIGKDARRVDILCHRIYLSYRLLEGTSRFKELLEIVEDAKAKLEAEVGGPLDGMEAKMAHGIVSRSSSGIDVQRLCSIAIQKADEWLSSPDLHLQDSLPAACRFSFVDITSSSLVIKLKETSSSDTIKGYKLWYWKSKEQPSSADPVTVPREERKILVFDLAPCTEYTFRVISFTDDGILGHSESRCGTGSKEVFVKCATHNAVKVSTQPQSRHGSQSLNSTGFRIWNIWKAFHESCDGGCFGGLCEDVHDGSCSRSPTDTEERGQLTAACRRLPFNKSSIPDGNVELPVHMEKRYISNMGLVRSNDSGGSETCAGRQSAEPPDVESRPVGGTHVDRCGDHNGASAMCHGKQLPGTRQLGDDYEHCVKFIRQLECNGHIKGDFRLRFLTWYSLRSTDQERKAVTTFMKTLIDDPSSLAEQLIDSFEDIISCKRQRTGACYKLWH